MKKLLADITADVTLPVRQFIDGFNKGDTKSAYATFAKGDIMIVDEFAPHQWYGPTAPLRWATDYDKNAKATGVTDGKVTYSAPTRMEIEGVQAYVIMPTVYLYKQKGRPMQEEGEITVVLRKEAGAWKMRGWTWSGVKPHPAK
jgi:ketosteroid isomerase-like protein